MSRKLEAILFETHPVWGAIARFNRANATNRESNDILALESHIRDMVKAVKAHTGDKKEFANEKIAFLVSLHSFLNERFDNLEQSIREFARLYW